MPGSTIDEARQAKSKVAETVGALAPVAGVGITRVDSSYAVKVNLREAPGADNPLPSSLDGVPIVYDVIGAVSPRPVK